MRYAPGRTTSRIAAALVGYRREHVAAGLVRGRESDAREHAT
jgi:hypothetical protein